jgi:hypothetical protein
VIFILLVVKQDVSSVKTENVGFQLETAGQEAFRKMLKPYHFTESKIKSWYHLFSFNHSLAECVHTTLGRE